MLDLASHDGRWGFAAIKAGAKKVIGIEARPELVRLAKENMHAYGVPGSRYAFHTGDALDTLLAKKIRVETVLLVGFFYHIDLHVARSREFSKTGAQAIGADHRGVAKPRRATGCPFPLGTCGLNRANAQRMGHIRVQGLRSLVTPQKRFH